MNISLPEALKRFVKERTKGANYSNPSDYVRSLIREDQRRLVAANLLDDMVAKHISTNPTMSPAKLEKLRGEFWTRWAELKTAIDAGLASLDQAGGKELNADMLANVKRRGRKRLASSKTCMTPVRISMEAAHLDAIWLHIASDSPANADRFLARLEHNSNQYTAELLKSRNQLLALATGK